MKRTFFLACISAMLLSCTDSTTVDVNEKHGDSTAQRNADHMKAIYAAIESGDTSKLRDIIAEDAVDHNGNPDGSDRQGRDSIVHYLSTINQYIDNLNMDVVSEGTSSDGAYHFALVRMTGTLKANPWGMPEGYKMDDTSVDVVKLNANGQITDHWGFTSQEDMMEMMSMMQGGSGNTPQGQRNTGAQPPAGTATGTR